MPNQEEFSDLLQTNLLALNRFVLGLVGNHFDAADIVQETAAKAFLHFADFRAEAKFKTWLMSIALNEVRGRRRREARSRLSYFEVEQLEHFAAATPADSPYRKYQEQEASRILDEALSSLHPSNRDVLRLRAFDERDIEETARRLSISVAAAKARYFRAVRHLSRELVRRTRRPLRGPVQPEENTRLRAQAPRF
jgi:RNA polymerase sigma-70 factor, ECF subfamily